jgi:hypothetical protein
VSRSAVVPGPLARVVLLALISTAGIVGFVAIRPTQEWILWLTAAMVALATDGIVRGSPRWSDESPLASVAYLFLPAITVLASGLFIDEAVDGYARPVAGVAAGIVTAIVGYGEYETVDYSSRVYGPMRLVLAVVTYLAAFALYTVVFSRDVELPLGATLVGLVSLALAIELLRESQLLGPSSLLVGLSIGVSMAELRLALYYFPLDGLLAGALLIIGFYLATGIVHHLLDHDLELGTLAEYLVVGAVGTAAVVVTRVLV